MEPVRPAVEASRAKPEVTLPKVRAIFEELAPKEELTKEMEALLLDLAHDFVANVITGGCCLAEARHSEDVTEDDIRIYIEKRFDILVDNPPQTLPS